MVKISLSAHISGFSLQELFCYAKEAGFDGIEYAAQLQDLFKKPQHALRLSKKYALPILSIHQPLHLIIMTPSFLFTRMIDLLKFFPDVMISNHHLSGVVHWFSKDTRELKMFLKKAKLVKQIMSFELNPPYLTSLHYFLPQTYQPDVFGQYAQTHNLSITFDVSHVAKSGYDVVDFFRTYHKNITLIHLSDYAKGIQHLPLGEGELPLKALLQEMKRKKYQNLITFEIFAYSSAKTKQEKLAVLKSSLNFVKRYVS